MFKNRKKKLISISSLGEKNQQIKLKSYVQLHLIEQ